MNARIRNMLMRVARQRRNLYYSEVGQVLNFSMRNPFHRRESGRILGEISTEEHNNKRNLLSVVVIRRDTERPGHGFFRLAKQLGRQRQHEDDEIFYRNERNRGFHEWTNSL
jgi:hypothetical protein